MRVPGPVFAAFLTLAPQMGLGQDLVPGPLPGYLPQNGFDAAVAAPSPLIDPRLSRYRADPDQISIDYGLPIKTWQLYDPTKDPRLAPYMPAAPFPAVEFDLDTKDWRDFKLDKSATCPNSVQNVLLCGPDTVVIPPDEDAPIYGCVPPKVWDPEQHRCRIMPSAPIIQGWTPSFRDRSAWGLAAFSQTQAQDWPHPLQGSVVALLASSGQVQCSGVAVGHELILTAAHCLCLGTISLVQFGSIRAETAQGTPVAGWLALPVTSGAEEAMLLDPLYCDRMTEDQRRQPDLGLIRFDSGQAPPSPGSFPRIAPRNIDLAQDWTVLGYGTSDTEAYGGTKRQARLRGKLCSTADQSAVTCRPDHELFFLPSARYTTNACDRDSGAPVFLGHDLIGIVRRGPPGPDMTICDKGAILTFLPDAGGVQSVQDWIDAALTSAPLSK